MSTSSGVKWKDDKKVHLSSKDSAPEIFSIGSVALSVSNSPARKADCQGIWSNSGNRALIMRTFGDVYRWCVHLVVADVKVWLEIGLLALVIGGRERLLCEKPDLLDTPKPIIKCYRINIVALIWLSEFCFFLNALDSSALEFHLSSELLVILSDWYSLTVFRPPGDLSAILFWISKSVITFLMPFNDFLVKLCLIWRSID